MPEPRADRHAELPVDPDTAAAARPRARPLRADGVVLVLLGGMLGTFARYELVRLAPPSAAGWPWPTFTANLAGAFVLGGLLEFLARSGPDSGWRRRSRLSVGTGFCGAFTTYSTLAVEVDLLVRGGHDALAAGYLAASVAGGLVLTTTGIGLAAGHHRLRQRRVAP